MGCGDVSSDKGSLFTSNPQGIIGDKLVTSFRSRRFHPDPLFSALGGEQPSELQSVARLASIIR